MNQEIGDEEEEVKQSFQQKESVIAKQESTEHEEDV